MSPDPMVGGPLHFLTPEFPLAKALLVNLVLMANPLAHSATHLPECVPNFDTAESVVIQLTPPLWLFL